MNDLPRNVLVVVDADDLTGDPLDSPLLRRASDLATRTGGRLLLLSICYDSSLSYDALVPHDTVDQGRLEILEAESTRLEATRDAVARTTTVKTGTAVRWGHDRSAEVLRAGRAYEAELIMKKREDGAGATQAFSTTDRDLLRDATVSVWLVGRDGTRTPASGVVAYVHGDTEPPAAARLDDKVVGHARRLAEVFQAPIRVMNVHERSPDPRKKDGLMVMASPDPAVGERFRTRPDEDPLLTESCDLLFLKIPQEA